MRPNRVSTSGCVIHDTSLVKYKSSATRKILGLVVGTIAVSTLVIGCTGVPAPRHTPQHTKQHATQDTTDALVAPVVRVPIACATLFSNSAVKALVGADVTLVADEKSAPMDLFAIGNRQAGILTCTWMGAGEEITAASHELSISIEPEADDDYRENNHELWDDATKNGHAGKASDYECGIPYGTRGFFCNSDLLVGHYWTGVILLAA